MAHVIQLHVWMQNRRESWVDPEVQTIKTDPTDGRKKLMPHVGKRVVLDVEGLSVTAMKTLVAQTVDSYIQKKLLYYYVVAVILRDDGEYGYKTIVRKTTV
jgi:hypothetical protein